MSYTVLSLCIVTAILSLFIAYLQARHAIRRKGNPQARGWVARIGKRTFHSPEEAA